MTKTIFSIMGLLMAIAVAHAQPVITASSFTPQPGEAFVNHHCNPAGFSEGSAGPNVTWNFDPVATTGTDDTVIYSVSGPLGMPVYFTDCNLTRDYRRTYSRSFTYYHTNSDSMHVIADYSPSASSMPFAYYNNSYNVMKFPLTYNNMLQNFFSSPSGCDTIYHRSSIVYDAYGTLTVNGHHYDNVVRTKSVYIDSFYDCFASGTLQTYVDTTYSYYIPGYHFPIVSINKYSSDAELFISSPLSTVAVNDVQHTNASGSTYPNPANGNVSISFILSEPEDCMITITDITGRQVGDVPSATCHSGSNTVPYNTNNLSAGSYVISIIGRNKVQRCNLTVVK